jgi:flagellar hook assembly protein FlgD
MFRKIASTLALSLILATTLPYQVFAADLEILDFDIESDDGGTSLDFAPDGGDDDVLIIGYRLSEEPDFARVEILDEDGDVIRHFTSTRIEDEFSWDGEDVDKLVPPGQYRVNLDVNSNGEDASQTETFEVEYKSSRRPDIVNFDVNPSAFDPDDEETLIEFRNTEDADITVEIKKSNGDVVRSFGDYLDDNYDADDNHDIPWDGRRSLNGDDRVGNGTYRVVVVVRNEYGVSMREREVRVTNSGGSNAVDGNDHIRDISFKPKATFNPQEDNELEITFDVRRDLDELEIYAVKGDEEFEIFSDFDLERRSNMETQWDGRDASGDYVEDGTWRLEFRTEIDDAVRKTSESIRVEYDEPQIKELAVSKRRFDPYSDETTFILFKLDEDAEVRMEVLEDGDVDDEIIDNWSVEANRWYAVEWDGDRYDYDDDIDIKLHACVEISEDVCDSRKVSVDLAEDETGSTRANITQDFIEPVIGYGSDGFTLSYYLEDKADITVTIHRGQNASGSSVTEKLRIEDQEPGRHELQWDGKDKDGDRLATGFYSYQIESKLSGLEKEVGTFVVGVAGGIEDAGGRGDRYYDPYNNRYNSNSRSIDDRFSDVSRNNGGVNRGVVVDGNQGFSYGSSPFFGQQGGFGGACHFLVTDVSTSLAECEAVGWGLDFGIFQGYPDGTFRPFDTINRAEALKVILGANNVQVRSSAANVVFDDVTYTAWYAPYIGTARDLGIFNGDKYKNTARPADRVNRAEIMKLLFGTLEVTRGLKLNTCTTPYTDVHSSAWYNKYACAAKEYKLIDGNSFGASEYVNRAEVADMLYRLFLGGLL